MSPLFKVFQFQAVLKKPSLLLTFHLIREQFSKPLFKSDILSESSISVGTKLEGRVIISFTFVWQSYSTSEPYFNNISQSGTNPSLYVTGRVSNVTHFGAFVDIGLKKDGLIHISQSRGKFLPMPTIFNYLHSSL